jgi:hypothetical protein
LPKGKLERLAMKRNVKRAMPAALILALALMVPSPASAAITFTFNAFSPTTATATYDWTSSQQIISDTASANATGGKSGDWPVFVFWDFNPAQGARFFSYTLNGATYTIPFKIYKYISSLGSELYDYTSGVTTDNVFSNTFSGAISNSTFRFAIVPTAGLIKPAGPYTTSITVGYYTGTKSGTSISNAVLRTSSGGLGVTLTVPVIYDLSILPSANTTFDANIYNQTLNFGDMTDGEIMSANAVMRTNATSWSLAVASTNAGKMKNSTTNATVPYTFSYNSSVKTLSTTSTVIETGGWTSTSSGYATRPLTFTLGDTFNTPGTYTDNLTFTLTAN